MAVGEVARLAGITVRTLHHDDEIARLLDGDLTPADELAHLHRRHDLLTRRIDRLRRVLATLDATTEAHDAIHADVARAVQD